MATLRRRMTYLQSRNDDKDHAENFLEGKEALFQSHVEWSLPQLDVEKTVRKLNAHESFEIKTGYTVQGLPKFDDLTNYGKSEGGEKYLWRQEVVRLVEAANSSAPISIYTQKGWFGKADRVGYTRLHKLAIQLQDALDICIHDNELVLLEHMPTQANRPHYDANEGEERYQRQLRLEQYNDQSYHALVNYITAMLLRVLLRTMRGPFWEENCVVTLAKISAKLKVAILDLPKAASTTLRATEGVRYRLKEETNLYWSFNLETESPHDRLVKGSEKPSLEGTWRDAEWRYFVVMQSFHHGISRLLGSMVSNLSSNEGTEMSADIVHTSATMYEDYITDRRLLLCAQRDGTISAAAEPSVITAAGTAFKVCLEAWEALPSAGVDSDQNPEDWTLINWKWTEINSKNRQLGKGYRTAAIKLGSMHDVINALVPYLTICSDVPDALQDLSNRVFLISDPTDPVRYIRQTAFIATLAIQSSVYMSKRYELASDGDACPVLESAIARQKALGPGPCDNVDLSSRFMDGKGADFELDEHLRMLRTSEKLKAGEALTKIQGWVVDESSIVISNKWYAWGSLAFCGFVVVAGLAVGGTVGQRIPGVDPFNISTFSWVLAGFILIVLKSLRVENWPWSRFFRGEVVCRSISEVHAVTGMDPQTILAILLRLEPRMSLHKRGPFGAIFAKRSGNGFSIDVPMRTSTLLEGGIILVKVQSTVGPALAAIRSHMRSRYSSVSPKDSSRGGQGIVCRDFLDPGTWGMGSNNYPLYTLTNEELQWYRIVGVFKKEAYFS
ncbi:hypothetical protein F4778DRAFT_774767 [Xylariomycetidae sp. FL2044]|nr:hypothetical protein F4778DRAFT_774767 [Xylariomycetidae sp. FL2044]